MGCDIRLVVEKRVNGVWERVEDLPPRPCSWCDGRGKYEDGRECYSCTGKGTVNSPYHDRNYTVFSVLADVRNQGNIKPISPPRELPTDVASDAGDDDFVYGDHSFSWLLLSELQAYNWNQEMFNEGFVGLETFKAWDHARGQPKQWSKGVSGMMVDHVTHAEMRRRIADPYPWEAGRTAVTLIGWSQKLGDRCKSFLQFMETLTTLGGPEDVRIVFGFDS